MTGSGAQNATVMKCSDRYCSNNAKHSEKQRVDGDELPWCGIHVKIARRNYDRDVLRRERAALRAETDQLIQELRDAVAPLDLGAARGVFYGGERVELTTEAVAKLTVLIATLKEARS